MPPQRTSLVSFLGMLFVQLCQLPVELCDRFLRSIAMEYEYVCQAKTSFHRARNSRGIGGKTDKPSPGAWTCVA